MAWQPIDTAPKDGSKILLYRPSCAYPWAAVDVGKWDEDAYAKKPRPFWRSMFAAIGITQMRDWQPTHWQPLPSAPLPEGEVEA